MGLNKRRASYETQELPPDEINDGFKDISSAGTAEALVTADTPCRFINIFAKSGNTGNVFVGGSTVSSSRGMVLEQARSTDWFPIDNVNKIYVDVATNDDGVTFAYVV